jgi:hypothetical protein
MSGIDSGQDRSRVGRGDPRNFIKASADTREIGVELGEGGDVLGTGLPEKLKRLPVRQSWRAPIGLHGTGTEKVDLFNKKLTGFCRALKKELEADDGGWAQLGNRQISVGFSGVGRWVGGSLVRGVGEMCWG